MKKNVVTQIRNTAMIVLSHANSNQDMMCIAGETGVDIARYKKNLEKTVRNLQDGDAKQREQWADCNLGMVAATLQAIALYTDREVSDLANQTAEMLIDRLRNRRNKVA